MTPFAANKNKKECRILSKISQSNGNATRDYYTLFWFAPSFKQVCRLFLPSQECLSSANDNSGSGHEQM